MTYEEIKRSPIEVLRTNSRGVAAKGILVVSDRDDAYFLSNDKDFDGDRSEWLMMMHPEFKYSWTYSAINLQDEIDFKLLYLILAVIPGELQFKKPTKFSL
jgi:hypothetical protein